MHPSNALVTQIVSLRSKTRAVGWQGQCIGGKEDADMQISWKPRSLPGQAVMGMHLGVRLPVWLYELRQI
jgi:hypothetical protein